MDDICPCCGAPTVQAGDPITAAVDVLVLRALELVGKHIVRASDVAKGVPGGKSIRAQRGRARHNELLDSGHTWHDAHVLWAPDAATVDKALSTAWDQVPTLLEDHGCCGLTPDTLTAVLDRYVRDLLLTQEPHSVAELRYRLGAYLGVPVSEVG